MQTEKNLESTFPRPLNVVVWGWGDTESSFIVREMQRRTDKFNVVAWFGLFEGITHHAVEFYKFKTDYDIYYGIPEDLLYSLQKELFYFVDEMVRRNEVPMHDRRLGIKNSDVYENLNDYHRYIYIFWKMLTQNKVDLVVIDAMPHCGADLILCKIAQYLGISILIPYPIPFPNHYMYFTDFQNNGVDFDIYNDDTQRPVKRTPTEWPLEKRQKVSYMEGFVKDYSQENIEFLTKDDFHFAQKAILWDFLYWLKSKIFRSKRGYKWFQKLGLEKCFQSLPHPDSGYMYIEHKMEYNFKRLWSDLRYQLREHIRNKNYEAIAHKFRIINKYIDYKCYRRALKKYQATQWDYATPFVFFALHNQPEQTTQCQGNLIYLNQLICIEKLAALLPPNWLIYVKDHPAQSELCRSDSFYERLHAISNVKLLPPELPSLELVDHCQFVCTISGTVGWEALKNGKNVLLFGQTYYQNLPGVFRYRDGFDLQSILNYQIDEAEFQYAVNTLIARLEVGVGNSDNALWWSEQFDSQGNAEVIISFLEQFCLKHVFSKEDKLPVAIR